MKRVKCLCLSLAVIITLSLLSGCSMFDRFDRNAGDTPSPFPTLTPSEPTRPIPRAGECYEPEKSDVILEFSLDDLLKLKNGIICFPDLDWDTSAADLSTHFGVSEIPAIEKLNPELWVKFTVGEESFYAVPYFENFSYVMGDIKHFDIQVDESFTGDAYMDYDKMGEISAAIRNAVTDTFGAPEVEEVEMSDNVATTWMWNINPSGKDLNINEYDSFSRLDLTCIIDLVTGKVRNFAIYVFNK